MNTRIHYLYRDANNYKQSQTVVIAGVLTFAEIKDALQDGEHFIPSQVGLPDPQLLWGEDGYSFPSEDDHVYCELTEEDFEFTNNCPTELLTAEDVREGFSLAKRDGWDVLAAMERLGLDA